MNFNTPTMTVEQYRAGHAERMKAAQEQVDRNLRDRERMLNPPPPVPPEPLEPPYDLSILRKPRHERSKLENLLTDRYHLDQAMLVVDNRIGEILSGYADAPCCSDCGARHGSKEYVKLDAKQDNQIRWLKVLNTKIDKLRAIETGTAK